MASLSIVSVKLFMFKKLEINSSHIERTPEDRADDFEITIYF